MENQKTHYRDGAVVLYKRGRSQKWQARFKIGTGPKGWKRIATGEYDIEKAAQIAQNQYDEYKFRIKFNLSPDSRRFSDCAEIAKKEMKIAQQTGMAKKIFGHYIGALDNYLIPFFGNKPIDTIDYGALVRFNEYRIERLGRNPARSTINTHNAALHRVFNVALKNNWIREGSIPQIPNEGHVPPEKQVRPYFDDNEYDRLLQYMKKWRNTGRKQITKEIRDLLYDYVIILANTGMRPGTESDFLKWNDIKVITDPKSKKEYLKFVVSGKTGQRELIADNTIKSALNRIIARHPVFQAYANKNPFEIKEYVFSLPSSGHLPKDLGRAFKKCLEESGLLYASDGSPRTLYSLRHTYATKMLIHGEIKIYDLAIQMGTSVAMIEKHYGHVRATQLASKLNLGKDDPTLKVGMDSKQAVNFLKSISKAKKADRNIKSLLSDTDNQSS